MKEDSMIDEKLRIKKGDAFILLFVFIFLVIVIYMLSDRENANRVWITVNGEIKSYSLKEECRLYVVDGEVVLDNQGKAINNEIVIANGQVYVKSATCKDQICVRHNPICKDGEMIICLPNEVFIEVDNEIDNEIDN